MVEHEDIDTICCWTLFTIAAAGAYAPGASSARARTGSPSSARCAEDALARVIENSRDSSGLEAILPHSTRNWLVPDGASAPKRSSPTRRKRPFTTSKAISETSVKPSVSSRWTTKCATFAHTPHLCAEFVTKSHKFCINAHAWYTQSGYTEPVPYTPRRPPPQGRAARREQSPPAQANNVLGANRSGQHEASEPQGQNRDTEEIPNMCQAATVRKPKGGGKNHNSSPARVNALGANESGQHKLTSGYEASQITRLKLGRRSVRFH